MEHIGLSAIDQALHSKIMRMKCHWKYNMENPFFK